MNRVYGILARKRPLTLNMIWRLHELQKRVRIPEQRKKSSLPDSSSTTERRYGECLRVIGGSTDEKLINQA